MFSARHEEHVTHQASGKGAHAPATPERSTCLILVRTQNTRPPPQSVLFMLLLEQCRSRPDVWSLRVQVRSAPPRALIAVTSSLYQVSRLCHPHWPWPLVSKWNTPPVGVDATIFNEEQSRRPGKALQLRTLAPNLALKRIQLLCLP